MVTITTDIVMGIIAMAETGITTIGGLDATEHPTSIPQYTVAPTTAIHIIATGADPITMATATTAAVFV